MKKKLTRALAVVLIAMMLVPTVAAITVSAAEEVTPTSNLINHYDSKTTTLDAVPDKDYYGKTKPSSGHMASAPIAVKSKQKIYIGPCIYNDGSDNKNLKWTLSLYRTDDGETKQKYPTELGTINMKVEDTFMDGSVILSWTVTAGNKWVSIASLARFSEYTLVTIDQPFNKEDYFAYADAQGWDLTESGLRPIPPSFAPEAEAGYEGLWNLFPREGERDPMLRQHQNTTYVESDYIPVTAGDVITLGAIDTNETGNILMAFDDNFNQVKGYKRTDVGIDFVEDIGYGYAICSHTITEGVAYVKARVHIGVYNDGDILVTRNQPFNGAQLRAKLGIAELSEEAKSHAFYGKEALFIGDSISYGSYDTPPSYRNPSASWARRLAQTTGLIPTNISYPGASLGNTGLSNVKWMYDLLRNQMRISIKKFDMIVFHGGVNDARQNVEVGTALPADTDRSILASDERTSTFAGGLQLMFHDAKAHWEGAELYYVANFKLVSDSVKGKDMEEYFEQAKILCAEYGVHYIDLYNDVELYETFDYESTDVMSDLIHPSGPSYDLLFPAVLRLFNETVPPVVEEEAPAVQETVEHTCEEVGVFAAFWNAIVNFFRRLFGQPEICTCGEIIEKKK